MMKVTIMGHAGLFIETPEQRILVDPILRDTPLASGSVEYAIPRILYLAKMPLPTLVVVTHGHLDHFDPESLRLVPHDIPLLAPDDEVMIAMLRNMGFNKVVVLRAWEQYSMRGVDVTATPSTSGIDELGWLFDTANCRFWHMSDADATIADGNRIGEERRVDLVSVKYQPTAQVQGQVFRNLGASFQKRPIIEWLEAACAAKPRLGFPYASGIAFFGTHAWNNRYAFPFRSDEIAALLNARLVGSGGHACTVEAGDIIDISESPSIATQSSPFIRRGLGHEPIWEPVEIGSLNDELPAAERQELKQRLDSLLPRILKTWLRLDNHGPLRFFVEFQVVWQLIVHLGNAQRLHYATSFAVPDCDLIFEPHPRANFFAHVRGKSLLAVLRGQAGAELLYASGDLRIYEKILVVRDGVFWAPPVQGWELYDHLPEPLTWYLRHFFRWDLLSARANPS
jgi:L-ascorbate metabolism protein UlaG (beta-lactamase superfamily)